MSEKTTKKTETKSLFKSLSEFQNEVPVIHKGTKGYGYTYAELSTITSTINPILKKHNLGFTQPMEGQTIKTIIFHTETGETLESTTYIPQDVSLKGMNDFQVLGSAITYIRRYALSSILGLVTDKDNDANGEQQPKKASKPTPELTKEEKISQTVKAIGKSTNTESLKKIWAKIPADFKKEEKILKAKDEKEKEFEN